MRGKKFIGAVFLVTMLGVAACGSDKKDADPASVDPNDIQWRKDANRSTFLGSLFSGSKDESAAAANGVGVNSFLWRASLDTLAFMPLSSADPFGGVIITDWYSPPETPNERFKLNVYILGRELRSDGVRVSAFRQQRGADGVWADAAVEPKMNSDLEDAILVRARQLHQASSQQ